MTQADNRVLAEIEPSPRMQPLPGTLRTLVPTQTGSRLMLEHTFDDATEHGSYAAGWHICLAVLAAALDGRVVEHVVCSRAQDYGWSGLRDRYEAAGSAA